MQSDRVEKRRILGVGGRSGSGMEGGMDKDHGNGKGPGVMGLMDGKGVRGVELCQGEESGKGSVVMKRVQE
jgi:hypothetical protein